MINHHKRFFKEKRGEQCGQHRHDNKDGEHGNGDKAFLQGDVGNNQFHNTPRIQSEPKRKGLCMVEPGETSAQVTAEDLAEK